MDKIHPSLKNPKTPFEKCVAKFEKRLSELREQEGEDYPFKRLVLADPKDISEIEKRWTLPEKYLLFLKNYSPKGVYLEGGDFMNGLDLFGSDELIKGQEGYSYHPVEEKEISGWPKNLVVIAADSGDPYCLDLDAVENGDAPVLTALHGTGSWEFDIYADTFEEFLQMLTDLDYEEEFDEDF